jgi:hypothetical protein
MSLKTTSSLSPTNNNIGNPIKPKTVKPSIPKTVTTTIKKNETPMSDEHFSLMKAAKQAGLPTNEQKKFADANADGKMSWTKGNDPTPNDDATVKADDYKKLVGTKSSYKLGEQETANLKQQVKEYVAKGGKLYSNQEVINNPNQAIAGKNGIATPNANTPNVGETSSIIPLGNEPKTRFSVLLNNDGKPITNERILTQFVQDRYQGGNLWGENYNQIANMSIAQGAKADNVNIKGNVGNKTAVYFDVSVKDQVKINENYKIVQSQVNEVEKIKAEIDRNNPVSQFILGAVDGVKDNLVGTATMIAHPLETLGAIKDVVVALGSLTADDVSNITKAVKSKIKDTFTTRDGINSIPYGAGYAVGMIATDIVIGKGVGIALEAVKEIPAIKNLLTKLGDLKSLATAKVAEKFSDEAASLAGERARKALATTVYSGIPVDVLADMAVVAGNKISKGAVKFGEFSTQMVEKFGEKVKPYIEKLYREQMIELNLADKIDEVGIKSTNINKLSKAGVYTEKIKWGIQEIEVRPDGKGFWGKRTPQNNPRVDAFERKINPNNESYYVKSPKGGYIQFENISQSALQDGKLVMQAYKSIYKVYDKPEFLRKKILDEATRQVEGAKFNGLKVEWLVSDKETVTQLTKFFKEKGVDILVKYLPE